MVQALNEKLGNQGKSLKGVLSDKCFGDKKIIIFLMYNFDTVVEIDTFKRRSK